MARVDFRVRLVGPLLVVLAGVACGSDETTETKSFDKISQAPKIDFFGASPMTIAAGETATLAWSIRDALSITIADDAGNPVSLGDADVSSGSVDVSPSATTSYTLTAHGEEDAPGPVDRTVTVNVDDGNIIIPEIQTFTASPTEVEVGGTVTLAWRTTNAMALAIKDDAGDEIALGNASVAEGSVGVKPKRSPTTFTLIANGGGRRATAEAWVTIDGLPLVHRFSVDPTQPVAAGASVQLSWETSRADRVVIKDDRDVVVVDSIEASGVHPLALDRTTEFRLTATGGGGEATAKVIARAGAQIIAFTAEPLVARIDDPITLTWQTRGADAVLLTGPGGFRHEVSAAERNAGTTTASLPGSGDYVLHTWLGDVVRTWAIFVEATEVPRIGSLVPDLSILTAAGDHPGTVILTYVQDGGTTCTLYRNGQAVSEFNCLPTGTVEVQITGASNLRLVADNHAGSHQYTIHVEAVDPARIPVFTKDPARKLGPGGTVELAWQVTDATHVWMTRRAAGDIGGPGTTVLIGEKEFAGRLTTEVASDTVFTLSAENSLGHRADLDLTVLAGTPEISAFYVVPPVAIPRDRIRFTWTCDGGDSLVLTDPSGNVLETETEPALIDHGSATGQAPAAPTFPNSLTYTLTVQNGAPQPAVATFELVVTNGPLVRSLTASSSEIAFGSTVNIGWEVENDFAGRTPTLVLTDQNGKSYDLTGLDPNSDTVTIRPESEGLYEFTLTATTEGTRPSADAAPAVVDVVAAPEILSFTADPPQVFLVNKTSTTRLAWVTENAAELWIFQLDASGAEVQPPLLRKSLTLGASQAELDEGELDVHPSETTRYILRIVHRTGMIAQAPLTIIADPPVIEDFWPTDADLILGESGTLNWVTKNTTKVMIQPMSPVVTALPVDDHRFVDISQSGFGGQKLEVPPSNDAKLLSFTNGFRFPFDGKLFDGVRVSSNGFLSFDLASTGVSGSNSDLPTNATHRHVHLAPFWDSLSGNNAGVVGSIWWRLTNYPATNRSVTIMWKNWSYAFSSVGFDFNFAVVLHENGGFEYQYGNHSTTSTMSSYINYSNGSSATIGFQDLTGTAFHRVSYLAAITGGISNRAWHFQMPSPDDRAHTITPTKSTTYKLNAANVDTLVSKETDVRVWPIPKITLTSVNPNAPQVGMPITFSWLVAQATRVRLVDEQGTTICEATDPAGIGMGSCTRTLGTTGTRNWRLEAINAIERNLVTAPVMFPVYSRITIDEFRVTPTFTTAGQEVRVNWKGQGGFRGELYECVPKTFRNACTPIDLAGQEPNEGEYRTTATGSKEYWFRLVDREGGRADEATGNVWVDIPQIDKFSASTLQTTPGSPVTLAWESTATVASITNYPFPTPNQIDEGFIDISNTGTAVPLRGTEGEGYYILDFNDLPEAFVFPYFGEAKTALIAKVDGVISFDTTYTIANPTTEQLYTRNYPKVELAPYWVNLRTGPAGKFRWELRSSTEGTRFLILQWTAFEIVHTSIPSSSLNFQVLLWENGDIDFRYAEMSATGTGTLPDRADGAQACLGIQAKGGTWGQMLATYQRVVTGGLDNRSWRFSTGLPMSGETTVTPTESTTYRLCATNESLYDVCEEKRVVVVGGGDLMVSEIMIDPTSPTGEWFEVRNTSVDPIDLAGLKLTSGSTESFTVPASPPLIVQPGGFAIFARSRSESNLGGVSPTVVYGEVGSNVIDLAGADDIALFFGETLIDRVTWTATWPIQANKSIVLEPSVFARNETANNGVGTGSDINWCASPMSHGGIYGSPGALGTGCRTGSAHDHYLLDPVSGMPWIDITRTGAVLGDIWSSSYTIPIPIGFTFPFFGDSVTEMTVLKDGAITLTPLVGGLLGYNVGLSETSAPNGLVAPMWGAKHNRGTAMLRYELRSIDARGVMIVQWTDAAPNFQDTTNFGLVNFQLQLWETGDIVFVIGEPTLPNAAQATNTTVYGSASTIGIKNISGTLAYQIYSGFDTGNKPAYPGRSYRLIPR